MATPAYMSIIGATQGEITKGTFTSESVGNSYQQGHENEFMVQAFNHEVTIPRDPQSGQPTGPRVHLPLMVTKVFDRCSPLLLQALTTGEQLTSVTIKWYRIKSSEPEHYYTTTLIDAVIVHIKDYMHNCQDPSNSHFTHLEDVHFAYRKITWTHEVCGTSGSDDWRRED